MKKRSPLYIIWLLALSIALACCTTEGERRQMARIIIEADSMNRHYVPMTSDSLLTLACRFYDRHGTPNERMKAHYLLGCAYRDMGEAPHAVDCYLQAAACADTTSQDCDYRTLGCIYSQMGDVYHLQLLLSEEIESRKFSRKYALLAGDTLGSITSLKLSGGTYIIMNKTDSAEIVIREAMRLYHENGYIQDEIKTSTLLMHLFIEFPDHLAELHQLIDRYDKECDLFDSNHELHSRHRQFYYYKGRYSEMTNQLDSAEYYYRKIQHPNMAYTIKDSMFKGLLSVFQKRNIADSIAKYARLYCDVNDSSIVIKDQNLTLQLAASYNYNRYQKEARENERRAHRFQLWTIGITFLFIILLFSGFYLGKRYRRKQQQLEKELADNTLKYEAKQYELLQMEQIHKETVSSIQQELSQSKKKNKEYNNSYLQAQKDIQEIGLQFEKDKEDLKEEIRVLKDKIEALKRKEGFSDSYEKARMFAETAIVKRIKCLVAKPQRIISSSEWELLEDEFAKYYPSLMLDLKQATNINAKAFHVCLLIALGLRPAQIIVLTHLSSSEITNAKTTVNTELFHCHKAATLLDNLKSEF